MTPYDALGFLAIGILIGVIMAKTRKRDEVEVYDEKGRRIG